LAKLTAILFPHTQIRAPDIERISALLGRLIICRPWFMPPMEDQRYGSLYVQILHPRENLRPKGDFKGLLSEYQLWIKNNQDKGYAAFLKATREIALSEKTPWEIRQMIRGIKGDLAALPQENHVLKWHLTLHLAQEIEENSMRALELLRKVKQQRSPLENALGEESKTRGLFDDLPLSDTQPLMDTHQLVQVFEAWLGLFGEHLLDHRLLIVLDRHVLDYTLDIFEQKDLPVSSDPDESLPPGLISGKNNITVKNLPRLPSARNAPSDHLIKALSGKTIVLLEDQRFAEQRKINN